MLFRLKLTINQRFVFVIFLATFWGISGCAYKGEVRSNQQPLDLGKLTATTGSNDDLTVISQENVEYEKEMALETKASTEVVSSSESKSQTEQSTKATSSEGTVTFVNTTKEQQEKEQTIENKEPTNSQINQRKTETIEIQSESLVDTQKKSNQTVTAQIELQESPQAQSLSKENSSNSQGQLAKKSQVVESQNKNSIPTIEQSTTTTEQSTTTIEQPTIQEPISNNNSNELLVPKKESQVTPKATKVAQQTPKKEIKKSSQKDIWFELHQKLTKKTGRYYYKILVDGTQRGTRTIAISNPSKTKVVANVVDDIKVSLILFNAYEYRHTSTETWENGRLVKIDSFTNKNGEVRTVSMSLVGNEFVSKNGKDKIPAPISSTKAWNFYEIYSVKPKMDLINTEDGGARYNEVVLDKKGKLSVAGSMLPCYILKYKQGDCRLWYSETGVLLKRRTVEDGREVVFLLESWD